jgi:WD40 repeat protein
MAAAVHTPHAEDSEIVLYDVETSDGVYRPEELYRITKCGSVQSIAFNQQEDQIITVQKNRHIIVYGTVTFAPQYEYDTSFMCNTVYSAFFGRSGHMYCTDSNNSVLCFGLIDSGSKCSSVEFRAGAEMKPLCIDSIAFNTDCTLVVVVTARFLELHSVGTQGLLTKVSQLEFGEYCSMISETLKRHAGKQGPSFSDDSKYVAGIRKRFDRPGTAENLVVYDVGSTPGVVTEKITDVLHGKTCTLQCFTFSADSQEILVGTSDCQVDVWSIATGEQLSSLPAMSDWLRDVACDLNSSMIAVTDQACSLKVFSATGDGSPLVSTFEDTREVSRQFEMELFWLQDGQLGAVSDDVVMFIDPNTGAENDAHRIVMASESSWCFEDYSKQGSRLVITEGLVVQVWLNAGTADPSPIWASSVLSQKATMKLYSTGGLFCKFLGPTLLMAIGNTIGAELGLISVYDVAHLQKQPGFSDAQTIAFGGDLGVVKEMLDAFPMVANLENGDGDTLAHLASQNAKHTGVLQLLVAMDIPLGFPPNKNGKTALHIAAEHKLADAVTIILEAIVKNTASNMHIYVHSAIVLLADNFPDLLTTFLSDVSFVESTVAVSRGCDRAQLLKGRLVVGSNEQCPAGLWFEVLKQQEDQTGTQGSQTEALVIPIPFAAGFAGRACRGNLPDTLIHRFCALGPDVFGNDTLSAIVHFKWRTYGHRKFVFLLAKYLLFLFLFTVYSILLSEGTFEHPPGVDETAFWFGVTGSVLNLPFIWHECKQVVQEKTAYLASVWNVLDLVVYGCAACVLPLHLACEKSVLAVASLLMVSSWLKLLFFLRAFRTTGPLVKMLIQITADMANFLVVLFLIVVGFSVAFYIEMNHHDDYKGTRVLLTMFTMLLGGFELKNDDDEYFYDSAPHPALVYFLFITYMVLCAIILLNLLIALMSDSYECVQQRSSTEFLLERAKIICEIEATSMTDAELTDPANFPKWLHVLRTKQSTMRAGGWSGRIAAMNAAIATVREDVVEVQRGAGANHAAAFEKIGGLARDIKRVDTKLEGVLDALEKLASAQAAPLRQVADSSRARGSGRAVHPSMHETAQPFH